MENFKIKVMTEQESKEVQELFFELGFAWLNTEKTYRDIGENPYISSFKYSNRMELGMGSGAVDNKEITIQQLRDLVVLKRNDVNDATHENFMFPYINLSDGWYYFDNEIKKWLKSTGGKPEYFEKLKPIEKEMKEYLNPLKDGSYELSNDALCDDSIEVPNGACIARFYPKDPVGLEFENSSRQWWDDEKLEWVDYSSTEYFNSNKFSRIVWQRHTHPEPLPFIDDNPQSLNDQYAEIEQVRQDVINNPNHYTSGGIECLDAMQAMLSRDEFIGFLRGNVFKYNWRYKLKNGIEDLKKAQFYQNKLIELESDNAL